MSDFLRRNPQFNEHKVTIGYACYGCNKDRSLTLDVNGLSVPRCPFCDGGLVLAGYSRFEIGGSSIGSMCHLCGASVRRNSGTYSATLDERRDLASAGLIAETAFHASKLPISSEMSLSN